MSAEEKECQPHQDKNQTIFEVINAIHASIADESIQKNCQSMRDKLNNQLLLKYKNHFSFDAKLIEAGLNTSKLLYCIHYSQLHPCLKRLDTVLAQAASQKIPVLLCDWSEFSSKKEQNPYQDIEEKRIHLHSQVPLIYVLLGCISSESFLVNSIANYAIAHRHASIYIPQQHRYIYAQEAYELGLIDAICEDSFQQVAQFPDQENTHLKTLLNRIMPKMSQASYSYQKNRLSRHLKHSHLLEVKT